MLNKYEEKMLEEVKRILGGDQKAFTYWDEEKENCIDVLFCKDSPAKGYLTASTLGLINYDIGYSNADKSIRMEMLMVNYGGNDLIGRILCTAAFGVMISHYACGYGTVFENILEGYLPESAMKHLVFIVPPPFWAEEFKVIEEDDRMITWLLALPISEAERQYLNEHGIDVLQDMFVKENIDAFDLNRKSVL